MRRPDWYGLRSRLSCLPSGHPLKGRGVRQTKHPTAFQSSGHSIRTKDFYNRLSFLNAATEKPGQTPSDRVPQIPPKTRLLWGQVSPIAWPFLLAAQDKGNGVSDRCARSAAAAAQHGAAEAVQYEAAEAAAAEGQEMFLLVLNSTRDGRLWRSVPGRRWYSDQRSETPASQEVVLIHRRSASPRNFR